VEEGSLARNISLLRNVLQGKEYIATIPKRGYCFTAAVSQIAAERIVAPVSARTMLAVLPFENLSGDPEQEYFADGLTEENDHATGATESRTIGSHRTDLCNAVQTHAQVHSADRP